MGIPLEGDRLIDMFEDRHVVEAREAYLDAEWVLREAHRPPVVPLPQYVPLLNAFLEAQRQYLRALAGRWN